MADSTTSLASNCSNSDRIVRRKRLQIADDKISRLPDEILCHILSSLPSKEAVRTSILSKQWSYVWTFLPILNIEINDHSFLSQYSKRNTISPDVKNRFMDIVDTTLRLKGLQKYSLSCSQNYDCPRVSEWMRAAFMHGVEEFDLTFLVKQQFDFDPGNQHVEFPISNKKLASLKLRDLGHQKNLIFRVPPSVYLPNLKILHLHRLHFCNYESMKNLILGCPVLEELYITMDDDDGRGGRSKFIKLFGMATTLKSFRDPQRPCYVKSIRTTRLSVTIFFDEVSDRRHTLEGIYADEILLVALRIRI